MVLVSLLSHSPAPTMGQTDHIFKCSRRGTIVFVNTDPWQRLPKRPAPHFPARDADTELREPRPSVTCSLPLVHHWRQLHLSSLRFLSAPCLHRSLTPSRSHPDHRIEGGKCQLKKTRVHEHVLHIMVDKHVASAVNTHVFSVTTGYMIMHAQHLFGTDTARYGTDQYEPLPLPPSVK